MQVVSAEIPDVKIIVPDVHRDARGYFAETYNRQRYLEAGITADFVQDNESKSCYGVLRGLHFQINFPQDKLVRVVRGEVYDVAVDLRKDSPTFGFEIVCTELCPYLFLHFRTFLLQHSPIKHLTKRPQTIVFSGFS